MSDAVSFELTIGTGVVRGYRWDGDANAVVMLHDAGSDLDCWGGLPGALHAAGYTVVAVDLPGHGLSDDPWAPDTLPEIAGSIEKDAQRRFLIAAGAVAGRLLFSADPPFDAVIGFSPSLGDAYERKNTEATPPALLFVGSLDPVARVATDAVFRLTRGWTLVSSFGTTHQGASLLDSEWGQHVFEQCVSFLQDYRTS